MAEGPIRRACNRCHTQKLSCKRVRNEPCERCVRLKAECKSSPSLRFRKPSNGGSNNNASKSSNRHTMSSHREQHTSNRSSGFGLSHVADFPSVAVPYPGPYSFDGMAEHLWPAHSVDAGLLIYRPDGNQIYQTLPPSQIPIYDCAESMLEHGYTTSPVDNTPAPYPLATMPSGIMFPAPAPVSNSWPPSGPDFGAQNTHTESTHWSPEPSTGISSAHMPHQLHGGMGVQSATAPLVSSLFTGQSYNVSHMNALDKTVLPRTAESAVSATSQMDDIMHRAHVFEQKCSVSVSKALFLELCAVSTQLLALGNAVPMVFELPMTLPEPNASSLSDSNSSTDGRRRDGRLSTQSSNSSFTFGNQPFPMDSLFALSQRFIEITQSACRSRDDNSPSSRHDGMGPAPPLLSPGGSGIKAAASKVTGMRSEQVDAVSFVVLANSTYTTFMDVYQSVTHLVHATAKFAQPPVAMNSRSSDGSYGTNDDMKHSMQIDRSHPSRPSHLSQSLCASESAEMVWTEETSKSCLDVCLFPDVSIGGFSIVSTPVLQLGLGLRLVDDFLAQFTHAMNMLHKYFSTATLGENVATIMPQSLPMAAATTGTPTSNSGIAGGTAAYSPHHPPLVFSEDFYTSGGMESYMSWDTATATSVSSASTADLLFTQPDGGLTGMLPGDDMTTRVLQLRQELAVLRSNLST